jgi:hypothetical protein
MRRRIIPAASRGKRLRGAAKSFNPGCDTGARARVPAPPRHCTQLTWRYFSERRVGGTSPLRQPIVAPFAPFSTSVTHPPTLWPSSISRRILGELFGPLCATRMLKRPGKGPRQTKRKNSTKRRVYSSTPRVEPQTQESSSFPSLRMPGHSRGLTQVKGKCNGYRSKVSNR